MRSSGAASGSSTTATPSSSRSKTPGAQNPQFPDPMHAARSILISRAIRVQTTPVRVGVIGTGFGARVVAPAFTATPGCEVVAVVSPRDPFAVEALCRRRDVDLVSVHSPPSCHAADVELALAHGHHVLCDKPFGLHSGESRRMLAQARAAGVIHALNFEFRFDPARERLHRLVVDGAVGIPEHVLWVHVSSGSRDPLRPFGWLFSRDLGGGFVGAWAPHAVDFVRWTLGEVVTATATRWITVPERPDEDGIMRAVDAEDGFSATLRTAGGVTCTIDATFAAPVTLPPRIVVTGSEGAVECIADRRIVLRRAGGEREEIEVPRPEGDPHAVAMRRWAEVLRDAVHEGHPVRPSFGDGVAVA
jgi:predicted dehydrogenase